MYRIINIKWSKLRAKIGLGLCQLNLPRFKFNMMIV